MVNRQKSILFLLFFLVLGSFHASLLQAEERIYLLYRLTEAPILDGQVRDDPAWKNISQATGFVELGCHSPASKQTFFQMGLTAEAIYIGVICEEPEMEKIRAKFGDLQYLWRDDSVEVIIFPQGADNYFQFIVNTIGARWGWDGIDFPSPRIPLGDWQTKTYKGEDYYSVEIKIPFEIFLAIPEKGEEWTGNISRNIFTPGDDRHTTWAYLREGVGRDLRNPNDFGRILITGELSVEETRKARDRIINILRGKIVINLESLKEAAEKIKECPALERKMASFLKSYEELEKGFSQLDTVKKAHLLLKKSRNLIKEADELKGKILFQTLFD